MRARPAHAVKSYYRRRDPLAFLDDYFDAGPSDITQRGWFAYKDGAISNRAVGSGYLDFQIAAGAGGIGGATSFWFDGTADGALLYKPITGPFDARIRAQVRNTAFAANPPVTNFRIAGLAAHDPTRTANVFNYVHIGAGSTGAADGRIEWKTTDDDGGASNDTSAFNSVSWGASTMDVDMRLVRRASNLQIFDTYWRASSGDLLSPSGWTLLVTVNRTSNAAPARSTNGAVANLAISMPTTVQVGPMLYSNTGVHDIRMRVLEARFRRSAA